MNLEKISLKKHLKNLKKAKILMIGPYPPDVGGISNFMYHMNESKQIKEQFIFNIFITKIKHSDVTLINQTLIEIRQFIRFLLLLKLEKYDIVHINTASYISFYRSFIFLFLAKFFFNTKCIFHIRGGKFIDFYKKTNILSQNIINYAFQISDLLIVTSSSWVSKVEKILHYNKEIEILHSGFEKEQFHPMDQVKCRKMLNLPINKKIIISIGALIPVKNHLLLIKAINKLIKDNKIKDIFCIIIGEGPLQKVIGDSIQNKNLDKVITIISTIPHEEIPYWINSSEFFVLPSTHEGNPNVMFECLGCGKPFIGTKVGGIPDIIISEDYGLIVEPNDLNDLTEKIIIALDKEWDENKILEYSKKFSFDEISKRLVKVYREILE